MRQLAIIEDNRFLRTAFRESLNNTKDYSVPIAVPSIAEFKADMRILGCDIDYVLLEESIKGPGGCEGIKCVREIVPEAKVIIMSTSSYEKSIIGAFRNGACGFIIKNHCLADMNKAIHDIETHGAFISPTAAKILIYSYRNHLEIDFDALFTKREREIIKLVVYGMSYKEMALKMNITAFTVNHHLKKIYLKLNVRSKAELISRLSGMGNKYDYPVFQSERQMLIA